MQSTRSEYYLNRGWKALLMLGVRLHTGKSSPISSLAYHQKIKIILIFILIARDEQTEENNRWAELTSIWFHQLPDRKETWLSTMHKVYYSSTSYQASFYQLTTQQRPNTGHFLPLVEPTQLGQHSSILKSL